MPIGLYDWEINSYGFCWGKNHSIRNAFKTYLSVSNQCLSGKSQEQHRPATIIPISLFVVAKIQDTSAILFASESLSLCK
jgi:hypothetical protein